MAEQFTIAAGTDKLSRSHLKHFIDAKFGSGESPEWYKVGRDDSELTMELNTTSKAVKNVHDASEVIDNGYEPSMSVDPYYARKGDGIYAKIKDIAFNRLTGDDCKTTMLEVIIDKTEAPFDAWMEDCMIKPQSYGGEQGGVTIPFTVTPCGNRVKGTVTITNKKPVFTADAEG